MNRKKKTQIPISGMIKVISPLILQIRTIRDNCGKLDDNKVNNLDEMDKFFDTKY